jgi:hypothetical protein
MTELNALTRDRYSADKELTALDEVRELLGAVVYAEDHELDAFSLALALTNVTDAVYSVPRVLITGKRGRGKTVLLGMAMSIAYNAEDVTGSTSFGLRAAFTDNREDGLTVIQDELQITFGESGMRGQSCQLRDILSRGCYEDGTVRFASSNTSVVVPVYAPFFMAGIGDHCVPDDVYSRCIPIRMQPKPEGKRLMDSRSIATRTLTKSLREPLRAQMRAIVDNVAGWYKDYSVLHPKLTDRRGEIWAGLFAVAYAVGGTWPQRCRKAFEALACDGGDDPLARLTPSQRLLLDMADVFALDVDFMPVRDIAEALLADEKRGVYYQGIGDQILFTMMTKATGVRAERKWIDETTVVVRYACDIMPAANELRAASVPPPAPEPDPLDIEMG